MRSVLLSFILLFGISSINPAYARQSDEKSGETFLNNVDAVQAMAIANQWRWFKKDIISYVTPLMEKSKRFRFQRIKWLWLWLLTSDRPIGEELIAFPPVRRNWPKKSLT